MRTPILKEYSPSCEQNKEFILKVLKDLLPTSGTVLEIGSGTGQHAVYFASQFPNLSWQPTDLCAHFSSIRAWAQEKALKNLRRPLELDLLADLKTWPLSAAQAIVCINTVHIVAWRGVVNLFAGAARVLPPGGLLYVYGAYRYATHPLEPSNKSFDQLLRARDPESGVRDFEAVNELALKCGMTLLCDRPMPGNNRSIAWVKN